MIVIRRGVRGGDMDGERGFEFVEDHVCIYIYLHSWGWGFCLGIFWKACMVWVCVFGFEYGYFCE